MLPPSQLLCISLQKIIKVGKRIENRRLRMVCDDSKTTRPQNRNETARGKKKKKKGDDEQWNILVTHIHMTFLERWA